MVPSSVTSQALQVPAVPTRVLPAGAPNPAHQNSHGRETSRLHLPGVSTIPFGSQPPALLQPGRSCLPSEREERVGEGPEVLPRHSKHVNSRGDHIHAHTLTIIVSCSFTSSHLPLTRSVLIYFTLARLSRSICVRSSALLHPTPPVNPSSTSLTRPPRQLHSTTIPLNHNLLRTTTDMLLLPAPQLRQAFLAL